jgi:hypothetical protein|tara:strand:+ start:507 stop:992 length:486 start_codon:yes stop_codon:yes gene_type:complete
MEKLIKINEKQLNLIAYLINEFAVNSCSMDNDNLNVIDLETHKRTKDFECLNEINVHRLIGHECEWFDEEEPYPSEFNGYQENAENVSRAFTTILAVEELREELGLDKELFTKEYFKNFKSAKESFNWIKRNKYLSNEEIAKLQSKYKKISTQKILNKVNN